MAVVGEVDWMYLVACEHGVMSKVYLYGSLHPQKQTEAGKRDREITQWNSLEAPRFQRKHTERDFKIKPLTDLFMKTNRKTINILTYITVRCRRCVMKKISINLPSLNYSLHWHLLTSIVQLALSSELDWERCNSIDTTTLALYSSALCSIQHSVNLCLEGCESRNLK